jgi:transposase
VLLEGRDQTWNLNEDHVKSIVFAHKHRLQRLADDDKFERRHPRKKSGGITAVRERLADKYAKRMSDFCHKAAAMLVGFAGRNHVGTIEYHERTERFVAEFPWFKLRAIVEEKATQNGISIVFIEDSSESVP